MKRQIQNDIAAALARIAADSGSSATALPEITVERARDDQHGDYASNAALALARALRRKPREIAEAIIASLPSNPNLARVEVAGPGFINFFLTPAAHQALIPAILGVAENYGRSDLGAGRRTLVEFVSANPTGPLHIGHGRGAAYGATLSNLLAVAGHDVTREYYVNDAGRQMDILTLSIWLRYLELCGRGFVFPDGAYRGEYVRPVAAKLFAEVAHEFDLDPAACFAGLPAAADADANLDNMIGRARARLGAQRFERVWRLGLDDILGDIRDDLSQFGVHYDNWYSEHSLTQSGRVDACIARLEASGDLYRKDGALWFRSTAHGDEKDRVVVRENGQRTYFASDIAYHLGKFERGFERAIDVWGADHHGYIARVRAALAAQKLDPAAFEVLLVQFATLYRGSERVQMSTRSGEFVTLRELRNEVGNDAARFFYVTRRPEQHLDFDLELAKSHTSDNPVYYIQYAHARVCSLMRQLKEKGFVFDQPQALANLERLAEEQERTLLVSLGRYPEVIEDAARAREPHQVCFYLRDLAHAFHTCYNAHQILVADPSLRNARVALALGTRQVIANGLAVIGVSAPESM
ncbi:MAG: arginine--tRNA ligase [Gammaproteobacteria bacterium]|nr:arginine--tRNA ligase [Gammaproteobacteria bacterium]